MVEKVVFDTNIYIGIFNRGLYQDEINRFKKVVFLVHPVLHELWLGAREKLRSCTWSVSERPLSDWAVSYNRNLQPRS